jgi:hypothetical protein
MIKINTQRYGEVYLNFQYNFPHDTSATLYRKTGEKEYEVVETAFVNCYYTDVWDKKLGRKNAFDKLMKVGNLDRADRTVAWEAFKSNCKLI